MAKDISIGNRLYLYREIGAHLGIGRQIFLPKVAELLEGEGVFPEDLGCQDWHEAMLCCSDFVSVTDFKGGRSYVTILRNEKWDEALAQETPKESSSGKGGKPWKKKKGSSLKAQKPRHIAPKKKAEKPAAAPAEKAPEAGQLPEHPESPAKAQDAPAEPATPESAAAPASQDIPAAEIPQAEEASLPDARAGADDEGAARAEASGKPHVYTLSEILSLPDAPPAQEAPAPEPEAPVAAEAPQAAAGPIEQPSVPAASPMPAAPSSEAVSGTESGGASGAGMLCPAPSVPSSFPSRFSSEVHCRDELLSLLTRMLPFDIDLLQVLDEDWQHALATGAVEGSRSRASFPIRFMNEEGTAPIRLTIRRSTRPIAGKQWSLILVDGDDGTGAAHEGIGIEGLPQVDEGAWTDLAAPAQAPCGLSPERAFAQFASIGSWDGVLGTLARLAAPERWGAPDDLKGRYQMLREYLATTFWRAEKQGRIAEVADAGFAAFDTGLVSSFQQDIYACFEATPQGPARYRLAGFAEAGAGTLGQKLVGLVNPLPAPPTYLSSLADIQPQEGRLVSIDYRSILARQTDRLPKAFLEEHVEGTAAEALLAAARDRSATPKERAHARTELGHALVSDSTTWRHLCRDLDDALELSLIRARRSYRWCAPAYMPATDTLRLLVPLALVDVRTVDCALVLELMPSGSYQASSVVTLPRACALARIISSEMPSWLERR